MARWHKVVSREISIMAIDAVLATPSNIIPFHSYVKESMSRFQGFPSHRASCNDVIVTAFLRMTTKVSALATAKHARATYQPMLCRNIAPNFLTRKRYRYGSEKTFVFSIASRLVRQF
jgi:hypothetical protein